MKLVFLTLLSLTGVPLDKKYYTSINTILLYNKLSILIQLQYSDEKANL